MSRAGGPKSAAGHEEGLSIGSPPTESLPTESPAYEPPSDEALSDETLSDETLSDEALSDEALRRCRADLVASTTALLGISRFDLVEDVVQHALMKALLEWPRSGAPSSPQAWLNRVARNRALDVLRRDAHAGRKTEALVSELAPPTHWPSEEVRSDEEIADDQLRMIFTCCHPGLPVPSQLALALKALCGFDTPEIARALGISTANAKKRITRAKRSFADGRVEYGIPAGTALGQRLDTVHAVIYALFNAGYHSDDPDALIRSELCHEAIRLAALLRPHRIATPESHALHALMCFHAARLPARLDADGGLVLLEEQNRSRWDRGLLDIAWGALSRSAHGVTLSRYHLEAGIAAKHAAAERFEDTDWEGILRHYDQLVRVVATPATRLNRAIALAFVHGPDAGITALRRVERVEHDGTPSTLWHTALGSLELRAGRPGEARAAFTTAIGHTRSPVLRGFLERQIRRTAG